MNQKTLNMLLNIAGAGLGVAGLVLILLSIFTVKWGMLCVALGSILGFIRMLRNKKTP